MARSVGLLSCDPGWRGLAFTLYIPCMNYVSTRLFHLNIDAKKGYKRPVNTIALLVQALREEYLKEEHGLLLVDKIIIESQFRSNMQVLSYLILAVLQTLLPWTKIEMISALKCKRTFNVPLGSCHYENKQRMLKYVNEHKHELIGGETVTNHDTADSVILLNTYLKEKTRRLEHNIDNVFTMVVGTEVICPTCGEKGHVRQVNKPGPNTGKYFLTCTNTKQGQKCGFKFLGYDEPEPYEENGVMTIGGWEVWPSQIRATGTKRKQPETKRPAAPAAKKAATAKPVTAAKPLDKAQVLQMFVEFNKTLTAYLDEKFDELRQHKNEDEDDSQIECSQDAPEEIE